ncbi:Menin [Armadillidium nasatum]|uniref:Menin n=1 Tax=Armadillidium nasatum TaxID=96803 RepID=A0A5N5TH74_9CRUS|nr:Menin [Armadillidium nasatum]
MAKLTDEEKSIFPLTNVESVVKLFKLHLERNEEPNLAICSIIIGCIENTLTCSRSFDIPEETDEDESDTCKNALLTKLPIVEYDCVDALYQRFLSIIKAHIDVTAFGTPEFATRELVKRVSDVVWCTLSSSYYKDRAHLQSIYSYMTGAKLDSSGTTLAVVASLQALGYHDAHLALSEDHTWVVCGENGGNNCRSKGNEDKRGIPVTEEVYSKSWLYVNGRPVVCTRHMEVATIISNMNPGINATTDSEEVILLQQALLWLLYDSGHLAKYPMAIDNLADLEEMSSTIGRSPATKLYEEAILSNIRYYGNQHVYPYTYLGGYCYRNRHYKLALRVWAKAAQVIRNYNYSRDDEEIYKEFLEIATELIPHLMRTSSSSNYRGCCVTSDPYCFAAFLEFYDGICGWEENSPTPVLHIGWAKALLTSIAKFDSGVRSKVTITCVEDPTEEEEELEKGEPSVFGCFSTEDGAGHTGATHDQNGNTPTPLSAFLEETVTSSKRRRCPEPSVRLYSAKMRGLKDLLLGDKLNSQAISLQLTAQSQVTLTKKRERGVTLNTSEADHSHQIGRSKRTRRDT